MVEQTWQGPRVWFIFQPKVQNLEDQDFSLGSRLKTKRRLRRAMLFFPPSLPSFSLLSPPSSFSCFFGLSLLPPGQVQDCFNLPFPGYIGVNTLARWTEAKGEAATDTD